MTSYQEVHRVVKAKRAEHISDRWWANPFLWRQPGKAHSVVEWEALTDLLKACPRTQVMTVRAPVPAVIDLTDIVVYVRQFIAPPTLTAYYNDDPTLYAPRVRKSNRGRCYRDGMEVG